MINNGGQLYIIIMKKVISLLIAALLKDTRSIAVFDQS